jgi:hypothetical protein
MITPLAAKAPPVIAKTSAITEMIPGTPKRLRNSESMSPLPVDFEGPEDPGTRKT